MRAALIIGVALLAAACTGTGELEGPRTQTELPAAWTERRSAQMRLDNYTHVGGGVVGSLMGAAITGLISGTPPVFLHWRHGEAYIYHTQLRNGADRTRLAALLEQDAELDGGRLVRFGQTPPTVRFVKGTSDLHYFDLLRAVQLINDSLPYDWKLRFDFADAASPAAQSGEIVVSFAEQKEWSACFGGGYVGCAYITYGIGDEIDRATVWIDHTELIERNQRMSVIVHEILHALGRNHPDQYRFLDSVMHPAGHENNGFILDQIDRDALFAVYDRIKPGTRANAIYAALGPWDSTSSVLLGALPTYGGTVTFGVASRNGLIQPWATGPTPDMGLADNPALRGSANWSGRMLGFTPHREPVGAKVDMTIRLSNLRGHLDFTKMEHWTAGALPGDVGTGALWGDGDLYYPIRADSYYRNSFQRTFESGDDGRVDGAFFGPAHEGMGGTLRREDLTAAFGGRRGGAD